LYLRSGESVGPLEVSSSMVDRIAIITEKHALDVATLKLRTQTTVLKYSWVVHAARPLYNNVLYF
jgi:hypothetical protein